MNAKRVTSFAILGIVALSFLALLVNSILHGVTLSQAIVALVPLVIIGSVAGLVFYWDHSRSQSKKPGKIWATMAMLVAVALGTPGIFGLALSVRDGQDAVLFVSAIMVISLAAGLLGLIFLARRTR